MKMVLIPGYRALFGQPKTYKELVHDIPSDLIISFAIALNAELNAPLDSTKNQERIFGIISKRFSTSQFDSLKNGFRTFAQTSRGQYRNEIFARRYLISLITHELNNYRDFAFTDTTPEQEFNLLLAYLVIIDKVNDVDESVANQAASHKTEENGEYQMLWTPTINQYEFNEDTDVVFEIFKLLCLCNYGLKEYRSHLKEYLNSLGFNSISQLIGSIHQIVMTTFDYQSEKTFTKLTFIKPLPDVDYSHLQAQAINSLIGYRDIYFSEIKTHPLYLTKTDGYLVIDEDAYKKKTFKGPFFELRANTSLKNKKEFNQYSSDISFEVLEKVCFRSVMRALNYSKYSFIYFDDSTDSSPDCYLRNNKTIFLFEFKAYPFPSRLSSNPDFDKIKSYIDDRFIKTEHGSKKGISQLINQIEILYKNQFEFDLKYKNELFKKKITIYPIICHNEFYFSMPGVNNYLGNLFTQQLDPEISKHFIIKPIALVDLKVLFDLALRFKKFNTFQSLLDRYFNIIASRRKRRQRENTVNNFFSSNTSFDEIYRSIFSTELLSADVKKGKENSHNMSSLFDLSGVTQYQADEIL